MYKRLLEKKKKSERKYIMITTLKLTLSNSLGRKEGEKEKREGKERTVTLLNFCF